MRITTEIAKDCAEALCKNKREEIEKEHKELGVRVRDEYMKYVPELVKECFKKHTSFIATTHNVWLGGSFKNIKIDVVDVPRRPNYDARLMDGNESAFLDDAQRLNKRLYSLNNLQERLEKTIKALGTSAKVLEAFPELAEILKEDERKQRLPLNVTELRKSMESI